MLLSRSPTTSNAETQIIVLKDDIREAQEEENSCVVGTYYTILVSDFSSKNLRLKRHECIKLM
jgi:hypothetical protein